MNHKGFNFWESHCTLKERKKSSRTKETFPSWGHTRSLRISDRNLSGGSSSSGRQQMFHQDFQLMEIMR